MRDPRFRVKLYFLCHNGELLRPVGDAFGIWMEIALSNSANSDDENEQPIQELIMKARAGDASALSDLIENYRDYLLLVANSEIGQQLQGKVGASDLVQQSVFGAQQNFEQFRGEQAAELRAWLRMILQNNVRKTRRLFSTRKRNSGQEVCLEDNSAVRGGIPDLQRTPSSEAIQREKEAALRVALASLTADHQTVIQLRNFEQLEFAEIGLRMERSADACEKTLGSSPACLARCTRPAVA